MLELRNEKVAIPVVLLAGILWSFGPLVVRHIDQPELVPWQYLLGRGVTIFLILNLYFFAIDPSIDVIKDFSVSLIFISFSKEKEFRSEGKSRKVIRNETNKPKVIIQPKSIIGFISLKTRDKNAHTVVKTV